MLLLYILLLHLFTFYFYNTYYIGIPKSDLWEEGTGVIETTFWKILKSSTTGQARNTVAIRTLPKTNGPQTGEGVEPGEIFEFVQTIRADFNIYLRLWADRGWLYEKHPKARYAIMERIYGQYNEDNLNFKYMGTSSSNSSKLIVYSGPSYENSIIQTDTTNQIVTGQIIHTMASFIYKQENGLGQSNQKYEFYKLSTGLGWVARYDSKSSLEILKLVEFS